MESRGGTRTLKSGRTRSVLLESSGDVEVVVKRFHHPGRLQALRDPSRARAEFRALELLRREGIRAPAPLELVVDRGRVEVRMEAIRDAVTLEDLLVARRAVDWNRVARRLGALLARLHAARVEHPDLHPGNVLVDADDEPWLIDFHTARARRRATRATRVLRDLVLVASQTRERLPASARARFLAAWRRTARAGGLDVGEIDARAAVEIEARARLERRAFVAHGANRWLRPSSRCDVRSEGGCQVFVPTLRSARVLSPEAAEPFVLAGAADEVKRRWRDAARLVEHGLPALRPFELRIDGGNAVARFVAEVDARESGDAERAGPTAAPERSADAPTPAVLGSLLGRLHDRGLSVPSLARVLVRHPSADAGERWLLAPPERLTDLDALDAPRTARFAPIDAAPDDDLLDAYLGVFDVAAERARVERLSR